MNLRIRLSLVASAITLAIGIADARSAREAERRLDRLGPARTALRQKLADTRQEILTLVQAEMKLPAAAAAAGNRSAATAEITPPSLFANEVVSDPQILALYRQAAQASLAVRVETCLRRLDLTPEMIARFEAETVDHLVRLLELRATADANGLDRADPDISRLVQEETRSFQMEVSHETGLAPAQFVPLLAQNGFGTEPSLIIRGVHVIEDIAATVQSAPLTSEQELQLSALAAQAYPEAAGAGSTSAEIDWQLIAERAQGVLAPPQIRAVQSLANRAKLYDLAGQFVARQRSH